jgi:hypothetical protein
LEVSTICVIEQEQVYPAGEISRQDIPVFVCNV